MIPREILKQVRRIEISTRGLVNEVFSGEYHSVFKGRGMNFAEVREYQYGDDIRSIDWNVTARNGSPFVKIFEEERELTVMLLVDVSASGDFGTRGRLKAEVAVEICALLAFSAIKNNDKVGLVIFSDHVEKFVPPRKGRRQVLRVLRELLYHRPAGRGTDITAALELVALIVDQPWRTQVARIDVTLHRKDGSLRIITDRGCTITWGRAPGEESGGDVPARQKLGYLDYHYQHTGHIDRGLVELDVTGDVVVGR